MNKEGFVYIMTNKTRSTIYIGVTNDLQRRIYEHKNHINKGSFTDIYNCVYLVFYEEYGSIEMAIAREKEIKKWNRQKKEKLIETINPDWLNNEISYIKKKIIPIKDQIADIVKDLKKDGKI